MKKIITAILLSAMLLSMLVCFGACDSSDDTASTPYIGENGNWWIGDSDTNIAATGPKGDKGEAGAAGKDGENGASLKAPLFRFNAELGCYELSYDEGATWTAIENYNPNGDTSGDGPADEPSDEPSNPPADEPSDEPSNPPADEPSGEPEVQPTTYEYPIEDVIIEDGTIAYGDDHVYKIHESTKIALIALEGLDYDTVSFDISDAAEAANDPWVCFAFLTELPELNVKASYAEGYSTFKFATYDCKADIPANAEYLVFYYSSNDTVNYLPSKITFTTGKTVLENLQDSTLEEYDLPMEYLVGDKAVIKYYDDKTNKFICDGTNRVAFVEITDTVFNYVILTPADREDKWMGYAFLTEMPEIGEVVSYAEGYDTFKDGNYEIEIPEDAKYLVIYYMDSYDELYYPGGIKFEK